MRRGVGVGAIKNRQNVQERFNRMGDALANEQLARLTEQLDTLKSGLEDFARKHRDKIRKNAQFRQQLQEMCAVVGVDPLASSKGFWAEKLGVGSFYYELAVQIVEVCLATSHLNGGVVTIDELQRRLYATRSHNKKEEISKDDIIRAVEKLSGLGSGFQVVSLGNGRQMIHAVPGELSMDHVRVLQLAHESGQGSVTIELCCDRLRWDEQRAKFSLDQLVQDGVCWLDEQTGDGCTAYWFPSLFVHQHRVKELTPAGSCSEFLAAEHQTSSEDGKSAKTEL